ncbi:hypothetical protein GP486_004601 [Trichoglossum hirsutum]|uniref:Uncharacterized protein n=1 Tax=Trichoglossum hirsutum TaxID=265104 RepID=A0A9P8RNS6_9PEZI|nr:hypothetical protein GP486_004601 [Trichoglossum hirsutum]
MDPVPEIEIVIHASDGSNLRMRARLDGVAWASIITRSKAREAGHKVTELASDPQNIIIDSVETRHTPIGCIKLRYFQKSSPRSQEEDFYVVENATHDVILGAASHLFGNSPEGPHLFPIGFKPQSKGSYTPPYGLEVEQASVTLTLNYEAEKVYQEEQKQKDKERREAGIQMLEAKEARMRQEQFQPYQQTPYQQQPYQQQPYQQQPYQPQSYQQPPYQQQQYQQQQFQQPQPYQQQQQQPYQPPYQQPPYYQAYQYQPPGSG